MDPLNKQERTEALLKMLAFFLLAVVIVSIPMYYAFRLPEKEAAWNNAEFDQIVKKLDDHEKFERDFLQKTDSAIALYNAYLIEEDEIARDKIQLRYSNATNQMEDYLERMSNDSVKAELYDNVIFTYINLFSAWKSKNELQAQLDDCMKKSSSQQQELTVKTEIVQQEKAKTIQEKEIDLIKKALQKHNGSIRLAAEELGTTERKLRKRMKELGVE
jgi:transcriptional regulator with GAF, ATPase, and Fis domain